MKVSRMMLLVAGVCLLGGLGYADTIPLGDPPGITIRPGEGYESENPTVQPLPLNATDNFGFSESHFFNDSDNTFLSASFLLTVASGFSSASVECDTATGTEGFVFPFCMVTPETSTTALVTFSTQPLGGGFSPLTSEGGGITPGLSYEVILNGGAASTCDPTSTSRTQCGWLDNHVYTGSISTSSTPPAAVPEPGTMALLLAGLGTLTARKRSRKRL
jgi:hypothetical protein